jgi:hypothetical protein
MSTPRVVIVLEIGIADVETEIVFSPFDFKAFLRLVVENKMLSDLEGFMHRPF